MFNLQKGYPEAVSQRRTCNTMTKGEETKGQSMNYKALHKQLKTEQHEPLLTYGGEIRWYDRVSTNVPISDTRRGNLANDQTKIFLKTHTHVSNK
jgi:hypothetical protein